MLIQKLRLPVVLVCTLLGVAAGAGGTLANVKSSVEEAQKTARQAQENVEKLDAERQVHALRLQRIEDRLDSVQDSLRRIEGKLGTR